MKVCKYLMDLGSVNDIAFLSLLGTASDTTVSYTRGSSSLELTFHWGKEMKVNGDNRAGSLW